MNKNYKVTLKDGTEFNVLNVMGKIANMNGAVRDSLVFNFEEGDYSTDEVVAAFKDVKNTSEIKIAAISSGESYTHFDYSILIEVSILDEVVSKETSNEPEQKVRKLSVTMGQRTYTEKQNDLRNEVVDSLSEVVADILGGAV